MGQGHRREVTLYNQFENEEQANTGILKLSDQILINLIKLCLLVKTFEWAGISPVSCIVNQQEGLFYRPLTRSLWCNVGFNVEEFWLQTRLGVPFRFFNLFQKLVSLLTSICVLVQLQGHFGHQFLYYFILYFITMIKEMCVNDMTCCEHIPAENQETNN